MILSYNDYITDIHAYHVKGQTLEKEVSQTITKYPENYQAFFKDYSKCPSCKINTVEVFVDYQSAYFTVGTGIYRRVRECSECGWWILDDQFREEKDLIYEIDSYCQEKRHISLVKSFSEDDFDLPLETLICEIRKRKDIIYHIHPYKMEELAQHVFSQFYNCEVLHVGKSNDGGKDLIMIQKDNPTLIQVKRRSKLDTAESISTIRDLLGTIFLDGARRGAVVSTAKRFSKASKQAAHKIVKEQKLECFELYDFGRLCEMLDVINKTGTKGWHQLVYDLQNN